MAVTRINRHARIRSLSPHLCINLAICFAQAARCTASTSALGSASVWLKETRPHPGSRPCSGLLGVLH